jgi:ankyrin repeat protein
MLTQRVGGLGIVALLSVPGVGAAGPESRLVGAAKNGDAQTVQALLQQGADVNGSAPDGTTPLHWAAHRDDLKTADLLIDAGADVKVPNRFGVTPLTLACERGNAAMVERLLRAGADPNTAGADGETALMTAARTGDADAVRVLLAHGADVLAAEEWRGQTALMWAAMENNAAAARVLLDSGADVRVRSKGGFTALLFAARGGHIEAARALLDANANVNETLADGTSVLVLALINAHYELGAFLVDRGADPNADSQGWTPLHQVAFTRNPNTGNNNPGAVPTGSLDSLDLVKKLVAHGANPNALQTKEPKDGYRQLLNRIGATPLLLAAKAADVDLMQVLVANGADPLLTTADRSTPLMTAAGVGIWNVGETPGTNEAALEAVKLCLEWGGDVTAVNDSGYTALHGAAHRGANAIVQLLVDRGARLDAKLTKSGGGNVGWQAGWTPLVIAEGVFYANTFKRNLETAALLRQLMRERGLPVDEQAVPTNGTRSASPQDPR